MLQCEMYIKENKNVPSEIFNPDISLMNLFSDTEELEMFDTDTIQNIIEYKWTMYGMSMRPISKKHSTSRQ